MKIWIVFLLTTALLLGCSNSRQPNFFERDTYVINTPEYPDNRVFYLEGETSEKYETNLLNSFKVSSLESRNDPIHGQPLSIIINSISLPQTIEKSKISNTQDIAVILDISAGNQGQNQSIVVWYQRGVFPGQSLNFANLLVFHQEVWDDQVPPLIRIRVMDVASERNLDTREALSEISKYGGTVALALQNPALSQAIPIAARAASLILANGANKMLLDYSVQFYKSSTERNVGAPYITPLKTGRFVLIGRSKEEISNGAFWKRPFIYDEMNGNILTRNDAGQVVLNSPVVSVVVNKESLIVPSLVAAKSAYLTTLLTEAKIENLDQFKSDVHDFGKRSEALIWREKVRRYRNTADLDEFIKLIDNSNDPLPSDVKDSSVRFLSRITNCQTLSLTNLGPWWEENQDSASFDDNELKVRAINCPGMREVEQ
ncbi:hypothetical protein [Pseudomonas protegens]|uniref:hypothetical protein n=1 Tax=Pseudomonas protegens TaxID=380021 RepID=UPI001071A66F|nr:hypothetical protein [Pseudomonas protegens]